MVDSIIRSGVEYAKIHSVSTEVWGGREPKAAGMGKGPYIYDPEKKEFLRRGRVGHWVDESRGRDEEALTAADSSLSAAEASAGSST